MSYVKAIVVKCKHIMYTLLIFLPKVKHTAVNHYISFETVR